MKKSSYLFLIILIECVFNWLDLYISTNGPKIRIEEIMIWKIFSIFLVSTNWTASAMMKMLPQTQDNYVRVQGHTKFGFDSIKPEEIEEMKI